MGQASLPSAIKLVIGVLASAPPYLEPALGRLEERFGPVDAASDVWPWRDTVHGRAATDVAAQHQEMGGTLLRQFLSFERLVGPGKLAGIKQLTNTLEVEWAVGGQRRVELAPGYVSALKLAMASTADAGHRVYLSGGIYAESALVFENGRFTPLPYTDPDYAHADAIAFFATVRARYLLQLGDHLD